MSRGVPAEDEVDRACHAWAYQWVQANANGAGGAVGALHCTLAAVVSLRDGAGANGNLTRTLPEVYLGAGLKVAIARQCMTPYARAFLWAHYVGRWFAWDAARRGWRRGGRPVVRQPVMAEYLGVPVRTYYALRGSTKREVGRALWPAEKIHCNERREKRTKPAGCGSAPSTLPAPP